MGLLQRDALLAAELPTERVEVPELGPELYVIARGLTGTQRDSYEKDMWRVRNGKRIWADNARAKLIVRCLVDDAGQLQYTEADIATLGRLRGDVLERIFDACRRLSGMADVDVEEKKEPSPEAASSGSRSS